jgi:hypothetical protein
VGAAWGRSLKHAVILQVCSLDTPFVPKIHLSLGAGRDGDIPFCAFLGVEAPAKGRPKSRVAPRRSDSVPAYHRAHSVHSLPSFPSFRTQRSSWSKDTAPAWHTRKGTNPKRCWELWSDGRAECQDLFRSALEAVRRESLHWTPKYASHGRDGQPLDNNRCGLREGTNRVVYCVYMVAVS